MANNSIISSLDLTYWFYQKAENNDSVMNEIRVQHLLFLSQIHYALINSKLLIPSLFVCSRSGFYEPVIRKILDFGLPLMKSPKFSKNTEDFLNLIWKKYSSFSEAKLDKFIISLECWKNNFRPEEEIIINPLNLTNSFAKSINAGEFQIPNAKNKILMSQNGPVRVSAWQPRKLKP